MNNFKFIISASLLSSILGANSIKNEACQADGYFRVGFQNHKIGNKNYKDFSIGGKLHIQKALTNNLSAGVSFYTTNKIEKHDSYGVPFFDSNNNSYTILGEAYLEAIYNNTSFKIGRQEIDTPFAEADDISMVPNSFEAAILTNKDLPDTTITVGYINRYSGAGAPVPEKFTKLQNNKGSSVFGVVYEGIEGLSLSSWYYKLKAKNTGDLKSIAYLEAIYGNSVNSFDYELGFQYAKQSYANQNSSNIYGASLLVGAKELGLTFSAAYNKVTKNSATNGFGGGPFFTSAAHLTIDGLGSNIKAYSLGLEWDASVAGIDGLTLGFSHFRAKNNNQTAKENDYTLSYDIEKNLNLSIIYSDIKDNINNEKFKNLRVFLNYNF
jgi:hypothetical protein